MDQAISQVQVQSHYLPPSSCDQPRLCLLFVGNGDQVLRVAILPQAADCSRARTLCTEGLGLFSILGLSYGTSSFTEVMKENSCIMQ